MIMYERIHIDLHLVLSLSFRMLLLWEKMRMQQTILMLQVFHESSNINTITTIPFIYLDYLAFHIPAIILAKFEELVARVRRKEFKKRAICRIGFFINDETEISVRM